MSASATLMRHLSYQEQVRLMRAEAVVAAMFAAAERVKAWFSTSRVAAAEKQEDAAVERPWYGAFY